MRTWLLVARTIIVLGGVAAVYNILYTEHLHRLATTPSTSPAASPNSDTAPSATNTSPTTSTPTQAAYALPIADFYSRITKKTFGMYITPATSPVQPERFTGYHTGVDVEYTDTTTDVPVYAIADGEIVLSRTASGYGGVMVLRFTANGVSRTAIYGHLRPSSLTAVGTKVTKGQQIAVLGTGYTSETDGERRHLHFAIRADNSINILGYVQNKTDLSGWVDPINFLHNLGL
ncbi:MAG TPA: M23 family metallopeptidase [Candidatus Saccharimonadales bacterium]|nr:M23 family metallopeptidase [Candidatus Saccharimonadales bacterium]